MALGSVCLRKLLAFVKDEFLHGTCKQELRSRLLKYHKDLACVTRLAGLKAWEIVCAVVICWS